MKRGSINKGNSQLPLIAILISLGLSLFACGLLKVVPTIISTPPTPTSLLNTTVPMATSSSTVATSVISIETLVLVKNYQISLVDACNTLAYKSLYAPPIEEWTTAPNGYNFLFTYLTIQEKDHPLSTTPDLPKTSFSVVDIHGMKYPAMRSSIEGACNSEDPAHKCTRDGKPFNMLVMFTVAEKLVDQRWQFMFKGVETFTFLVSHGSLCPAKDR
jgi:hypothetical protein